MSFRTGLVSITFRRLSPREIVDLVAQGGLQEIEWGGDIHVPAGDLARAKEVRRMTADAGLTTAAYGSYYRLGQEEGPDIHTVLETAYELRAPTVRIWAGNRASADADQAYRDRIAKEALEAAERASNFGGLTISLEYHAGTLTDTTESATNLLLAAPHKYLHTLWQPPNGQDAAYCEAGLRSVMPRLSNIHAFHWWPTNATRHPLDAGWERWKPYFEIVRAAGKSPTVLLEFVKGDEPAQFLEDAATLKSWVAGAGE